jgi:hypothetical protein
MTHNQRRRLPRVRRGLHLPGILIVGVLALAGVLITADKPLWDLAAVLFSLAAVLAAATRWRRDEHGRDGTETVDAAPGSAIHDQTFGGQGQLPKHRTDE